MINAPLMAAASSITRIAAFNTSRSSIRSDWPRRASSLPLAALVTATTTPSLKRSTASTRPRSFIGADHGGISRRWNSQPWNGSIGSIIDGFWSPSETSRQPKPRSSITPCWTNQHWLHNLNQIASGKSGAVHILSRRTATYSYCLAEARRELERLTLVCGYGACWFIQPCSVSIQALFKMCRNSVLCSLSIALHYSRKDRGVFLVYFLEIGLVSSR